MCLKKNFICHTHARLEARKFALMGISQHVVHCFERRSLQCRIVFVSLVLFIIFRRIVDWVCLTLLVIDRVFVITSNHFDKCYLTLCTEMRLIIWKSS